MLQPPIAIRSYRLLFRDANALPTRSHDADLASDEEARELAALMLDEKITYSWVEVWDRARLVCTVRRGQRQPHERCSQNVCGLI
jgi:hypothetical protein